LLGIDPVRDPAPVAPPAPRGRPEVLITLLLMGLTLAAYARACGNDFVNYDDDVYVTHNPHVGAGLTAADAAWAFTTTRAGNWHPLTWLSLQLDATLYGLNPAGFHVTNVLLHIANCLLVFAVLWPLTGAVWRSGLVAALFAWHPLHVESVAWVAERKDVLSTLFGLLAIGAYLRYVEGPGWMRYGCVLVLFALSLLAKPTLVTLPCLLLLLDYWPLQRWRRPAASADGSGRFPPTGIRRLVAEKVPLLGLAAASCAVTLYAQQRGGAVLPTDLLPVRVRLGNALVSYVRYLGHMLWPQDLAVFYPYFPDRWHASQVAGAGLLLAGVTLTALAQARRRPYLLVGWLWYLGALVPVIGLVQVGSQSMADRYTYVPLIGVFIVLVWGLADLAGSLRTPTPAVAGVGAVVAAGCLAGTWVQTGYWRDSLSLWEHAVRATAFNYIAHNNLGVTLRDQGRLADAAAEFQRAAQIHPGYADAEANLGAVLARRRQLPEAASHLSAALRIDPRKADTYADLGAVLSLQGDPSAAAGCYRRAIALRPDVGRYYYGLGHALERQGEATAARGAYDTALRLDPGWPESAIRSAWVLATNPNTAVRDGPRAVELARQACEATGCRRGDYLDTLAAAYAEVGRFGEATDAARQALAAMAGDPPGRAQAVRQRLGLYEQGRPFRATEFDLGQ
jgi:tetratricopeptide (TPR) repeat protein